MLFTWMCRTMFPELSSAHSNSSSTLPNSEESWSLWSSGCRELRIDFQKDPILLCSSCARTDRDATSEACYRPNLKLPDSPTVRNYPVKIYPEKIMFNCHNYYIEDDDNKNKWFSSGKLLLEPNKRQLVANVIQDNSNLKYF